MAQRYVWPHCTYVMGSGRVCACRRTWDYMGQAVAASLRHGDWSDDEGRAICYCHGLERGATFPCDTTQKLAEYV